MKTTIALSFATVLALPCLGQLKVVPTGYVGIGCSNPTQNLEVMGNALLSTEHSKLMIGNTERFLGLLDDYDKKSSGDLSLINITQNWTRISATSGIALYGGGGGEYPGNTDYTAFVQSTGFSVFGQLYSSYAFGVYGDGFVTGSFWNGSDARFKRDIKEVDGALAKVLGMRGVTYNFRTEEFPKYRFTRDRSIGFIAQELKDVLPEAVRLESTGYYDVNYTAVIPVLVEAIKEQQAQIAELQALVAMNGNTQKLGVAAGTSTSKLFQNDPNPFQTSTTIRYALPATAKAAHIYVYDLTGKQLMDLPITSMPEGAVTVEGSRLPAGTYQYTMIVDGQVIDSKKMILTN